jgi:hypothetical protein
MLHCSFYTFRKVQQKWYGFSLHKMPRGRSGLTLQEVESIFFTWDRSRAYFCVDIASVGIPYLAEVLTCSSKDNSIAQGIKITENLGRDLVGE